MQIIKNYLKMKNVQRLSSHSVLKSCNLLEHSFLVACLFKEFCQAENIPFSFKEFDLVMNHDLLETETGDLSWVVKNLNTVTKQSWFNIEEEVLDKHAHLDSYSDKNIALGLNKAQYEMFKVCDLLELWIFCVEESKLGNKNLIEVERTCLDLMWGKFKSVDNFVSNYV